MHWTQRAPLLPWASVHLFIQTKGWKAAFQDSLPRSFSFSKVMTMCLTDMLPSRSLAPISHSYSSWHALSTD